MSILNKMKKVKKERSIKKHPLADKDISFRYGYVTGCVMATFADETIDEKEYTAIETLVLSLQLPEEYIAKVIEAGKAAEEEMIHAIIESLQEKREQYLFVLDLYQTVYLQEAGAEVIAAFMDMLDLNEAEQQFLQSFAAAVHAKDAEVAGQALQAAYENELEPPFEGVKYFIPDLSYREEIEGCELTNGQKLKLSRPCLLKGEIVVHSGAELDISDTEIIFGEGAGITVEGGTLKADNSKWIATEQAQDTLVNVKDVMQLCLNGIYVNGNHFVRALMVTGSVVTVENSKMENCYCIEHGGAIHCSNGSRLTARKTVFLKNQSLQNGGTVYIAKGSVHLECCSFHNEKAGYGGAIYLNEGSMELADSIFEECVASGSGGALNVYSSRVKTKNNHFTRCEALNNGGGVLYNAFGSTISGDLGTFIECKPDDVG